MFLNATLRTECQKEEIRDIYAVVDIKYYANSPDVEHLDASKESSTCASIISIQK